MNVSNREESFTEDGNNENFYLTKVLLFASDALQIAEELKSLSNLNVSTNCLNTIGMYPLIERVETPIGTVCISIWIINTNERFDPFRLGYYSGASHTILLYRNQEDLNNFSQLHSYAPSGVPTTILTLANSENDIQIDEQGIILDQNSFNALNRDLLFFRNISQISDLRIILNDLGQRIIEDIVAGEYRTFTPQIVKPSQYQEFYNNESMIKTKELVERLGYIFGENGKVNVMKDDFTFQIDFYRNQVTASISACENCEERCKHYRKLCVVEKAQGYSNAVQYDNLRGLAILYSLYDGNFFSLTGDRKKEDIEFQLNRLKTLYNANCRYMKEEQTYQESLKKHRNTSSKRK